MMQKKFFHGSYDFLPIGTILKPRTDYKNFWSNTDFYSILETYRPHHMLAHHESVFMCDNSMDIDNAGGGTEWLFTVKPDNRIEKHDLHWCSEISIALSNGDGEEVLAKLAEYYWNGTPSNEPVWEYLTYEAKIINIEEY